MGNPNVRFSRGVSEGGSWEMIEAPVRPDLRVAINRLCGFAEDTTGPVRRTELPGPSCVLIISFGSPYRLESPTGSWDSLTPRFGFLGGLGEEPAVDIAGGSARCVQIDLAPTGLYRLLGVPMSEVANRVLPIEDVFGSEASRLSGRLASAATWPTRLEIIEHELRSRLEGSPPVDRRVEWAWNQLVSSGGDVEIALLASRLEISRKHLIDLFRNQVGLPPKRAARLIRFNRAAQLARGGKYLDWTDLAQSAGYFDQAHFINEVRRFSGQSPSDAFGHALSTAASL